MNLHAGWLLYDVSFPWDTNITSFITSFEFPVITLANKEGYGGEGMAFFISLHNTVPNHNDGIMLGLTSNDTYSVTDPSHHLFFFKFDTFQNTLLNDPNRNHTGIDINSLTSDVTFYFTTSSLCLDVGHYKNSSFMVWVDYFAALVEVWMVKTNHMKSDTILSLLADPLLNVTYDLSTVFFDSPPLFVVLSATTSESYQCCAIFAFHTLS